MKQDVGDYSTLVIECLLCLFAINDVQNQNKIIGYGIKYILNINTLHLSSILAG